MRIKSFLKNHKKGLIATTILIILYVIIFEINFFFDPLRNKPDTIEVYKYGQKYEYHQSDKQFKMIYGLLHRYSKGTINRMLHGMSASYRWGSFDVPNSFISDGIAVRVIYNDMQQDSRLGGYNASYHILVFMLNNNNHDYNKETNYFGYCIPYITKDQQAKDFKSTGYGNVIIKFPYPTMVEWYVNIGIS